MMHFEDTADYAELKIKQAALAAEKEANGDTPAACALAQEVSDLLDLCVAEAYGL